VQAIQLGTLATLLLHGCATESPKPLEATPLSQLSPEVRDAWESHRNTLIAMARSGHYMWPAYDEAVDFFERVTQLKANDDGSDIGRMPTGELESDIAAWDAWLSTHASCLRWNASQSMVECEP
jgi:hypothetical protein